MNEATIRLTTAQALVEFLANQYSERDGVEQRLVAGCFGIFGHGNVAGIGEALHAAGDRLRYYPARNEQGMVHVATGFARMRNRLSTLACTTSIGPGATNLVTGAATATVNRIPVLLLPGDVFATRRASPVLQQLEASVSFDVSVNDCLRPVSRFWDRINRPEQLPASLLEAMRVLTDPVEAGAVTIALPQDVQVEAFDFPVELLRRRVWPVVRRVPDPATLERAAAIVRGAARPLLVAGGGLLYSDASNALRALVDATGLPVAETQAGKGAMPFDHPCALGAIGVTGTPGANAVAGAADVVIGVGTRWSDFTTASHTLFADASVQFVNINVAAADATKLGGAAVVADAIRALDALAGALQGWRVDEAHRRTVARHGREWDAEVERVHHPSRDARPSQEEVIGAVNDTARPEDVVVCAAGSLPADLHRLWRARDPKGYHVEYGFSCMGYEIAGGVGVKLAAPDRVVYVLVGDGSYLMLAQEIVTSIQEALPIVIVLVDNHGFASIGSLSQSIGSEGFGTRTRARDTVTGELDGPTLPIDLAANAASLGADVIRVSTVGELRAALDRARSSVVTTVVHVELEPAEREVDATTWWDVAVAEVSTSTSVRSARATYERRKQAQRRHF